MFVRCAQHTVQQKLASYDVLNIRRNKNWHRLTYGATKTGIVRCAQHTVQQKLASYDQLNIRCNKNWHRTISSTYGATKPGIEATKACRPPLVSYVLLVETTRGSKGKVFAYQHRDSEKGRATNGVGFCRDIPNKNKEILRRHDIEMDFL
jgi:hypothetical protein